MMTVEGSRPLRGVLEERWLALTRKTLPALAAERAWPVCADHCFQRILLDHAAGGVWYDHVAGRPAYRHVAQAQLPGPHGDDDVLHAQVGGEPAGVGQVLAALGPHGERHAVGVQPAHQEEDQ